MLAARRLIRSRVQLVKTLIMRPYNKECRVPQAPKLTHCFASLSSLYAPTKRGERSPLACKINNHPLGSLRLCTSFNRAWVGVHMLFVNANIRGPRNDTPIPFLHSLEIARFLLSQGSMGVAPTYGTGPTPGAGKV